MEPFSPFQRLMIKRTCYDCQIIKNYLKDYLDEIFDSAFRGNNNKLLERYSDYGHAPRHTQKAILFVSYVQEPDYQGVDSNSSDSYVLLSNPNLEFKLNRN